MACICNEGFSGNPNNMQTGCQQEFSCGSSKDCPAGSLCQVNIFGKKACLDPCQIMSCPDGEKCQIDNGKPLCACQKGYSKNKVTGVCEIVAGCRSNNDCRPSEACREGTFGTKTCEDVCSSVVCPNNAACVADDHRAYCKCTNGYAGNPDNRKGCTEALTLGCSSDVQCPEDQVCRLSQGRKTCIPACTALQCGPGAICTSRNHVAKCTCPPGLFTGDPYGSTKGCSQVNCLENDDCPASKYCDRLSYTCMDVCKTGICGDAAVCVVENHSHRCTCPPGFQPDPSPEVKCAKLQDDEKCPVGLQCQLSCFTNQQCPQGQTCKNGLCKDGCADHKDCPGQHVCVQERCVDPCSVGKTCGPNSQCEARNKAEHCSCPSGFAGVPTAIQGCVRIPEVCSGQTCPPGHKCLNGYCMPSCKLRGDCAKGEQCVDDGMCLKLCHSDKNCLQGEICIDKFCRPGCNVENDCRKGESCNNGRCECTKGFISTPQGCQDIDECQNGNNVCPAKMVCKNKPGSFQCVCPPGTVGDATKGCTNPNQCFNDALCADNLACVLDPLTGRNKCKDPCEFAFCTEKASCQTINHKPFCSCPPGHQGDPTDPNIGCYKVECVTDANCAANLACDAKSKRCINPCNSVSCGKGSCRTENHKPVCYCQPGFQPSNGQCVDIDECSKPGTCHSTAICRNSPGSFTCSCPEGSVGDARTSGCKPRGECAADRDCPAASACREGRCVDPCIGACGQGALCEVVGHQPLCSCPARTQGNPRVECRQLECVENTECPVGRSCVQNKCVDACSLAGVCGANALCTVQIHTPLCSCQGGFTGDPTVGCSPILICSSQAECPANLQCAFGVCSPPCSSLRDCLDNQVCVNGKCAPRCTKNNQCPNFHECRGGVCALAEKCRSNADCSSSESCTTAFSSLGQRECKDVCSGPVICGRNAVCQAVNHRPICTCPEGYKLGPSGRNCIDLNECNDPNFCNNGRCINTDGSAECQCANGFILSQDNSKCIDMRQEPCFNNFQCSISRPKNMTKQNCCCSFGKSWGTSCDRCPTEGTSAFKELCPLGPGRGEFGEDFDECQLLGPDICDAGICINTDGSYRCECPKGYKLDSSGKKCVDDDECLSMPKICGNGTCSNVDGSFECACAEGYAPGPLGNCEDVDECVEYGHQCAFRCHNIAGSYRCICPYGYEVAPDGRHCVDINECISEANDCRYDCKNLIGTFMCVCPDGFRKLGVGDECEDINECANDPDICQGGGRCINTAGGYICECSEGYELSLDGKECLDRRLGYCYDRVLGGGRCRQTGVSGFANQQQIQVTKSECCCAMGAAWGSAEQSESTFGMSNACEICPGRRTEEFDQLCLDAGFGSEGNDIDECKILPNLCENGQCINTLGSYRCICNRGFKPDAASDGTKCIDVNECLQRPGPCEHECTNSWGSYTCSCPHGYVLNSDGKTCRDLDECATGSHTCQYECINTLGNI